MMKIKKLALILLLVSTSAFSADYSLGVGAGKNLFRSGVNFHPPSKFITELGDYSIMLHPEFGVSAWHGENGEALQFTATPMFRRAIFTPRWFIEIGVGVSHFSNKTFSEKLGSHFQFADHIGLGWRYGNRTFGARISHFSNAGMKKPNPGLELIEIYYRANFK